MTESNFLTILSALADKIEMMQYLNNILDEENKHLNKNSKMEDED